MDIEGYTINKAKDPNFKNKILELLKAADLGIQDIQVEMLDLDKLPSDMPKELRELIIKKSEADESAEFLSDVLTSHKKYDDNKNLVW